MRGGVYLANLNKLDLGSHMMFIGEMTESKKLSGGASCTYAHYHNNIKK